MKSPDSNIYMTWLFHRDERQCAADFVSAHTVTTPATPTPAGPTPASPQAMGSEPEGNSTQLAESCSPPVTSAMIAASVPEEARAAAERWLGGYRRADVLGLTDSSAMPFTDVGNTVAEDRTSMSWFYQKMVASGTPKQESVRYYTAGQITKLRGSLPRGGEKEDMVFAWIEHGGEDLILILQPACRGWRVAGIDR
jgi:hypothetical protein